METAGTVAGAQRRAGSPRLEAVLRDWTRRIGPEAAAHRVAYYRVMVHGWLAGVAGVVLAVAGGMGHVHPLSALAVVLLAAWFVLYLRAWRELHRMNGAAASALGVAIHFSQTPPASTQRYRRWCERRHLEPDPFPDAEPLRIRTTWF